MMSNVIHKISGNEYHNDIGEDTNIYYPKKDNYNGNNYNDGNGSFLSKLGTIIKNIIQLLL